LVYNSITQLLALFTQDVVCSYFVIGQIQHP
jgi:hypothetical protein